jgi:hypothetical protein
MLRGFGMTAAFLLLICGTAAAQPSPDPRTEAKAHVGPFYITPSLTLKEFGVDTNVFNNAEEKRDFTVTFAPDATIWVPFGRKALLTTSLAADLVHYQRYSNERSINPSASVRGDLFVKRVTLFAEPSYLRSRQALSIELDARVRREERGVKAGVDIRLSRSVAIDLRAQQHRMEFDGDEVFAGTRLRDTMDREGRTVSASVRHDLTPLTTVTVRAERSEDRFTWSPVRDADTLLVASGVEFRPRALISGSASVGVRQFEPRSALLEPFRGVVGRAALAYAIGDASRLEFAAERDVNYSYEPLQPYFVIEGYSVSAGRRLIGRTDITLGALRHRYAYRDVAAVDGGSAAGRVDLVHVWSASIGYRFTRTSRLGFGAAYRTRTSNNAHHRDYEGLRLSATTDYEF